MILELLLLQHFRIWPKAKRRNGRLPLQTGTWHITKYFRPNVFCETFTQQYLGACLCQTYMEQWMADRGWVMDMNSFMVRFILFLITLCPENGDVVVYRRLNHCQRVTPYEKMGQFWLKYRLVFWGHQAYTWFKSDFSSSALCSVTFNSEISQDVLIDSIRYMC